MILGTINAIDNANGLKVQIDGETSASKKKYSYLASYVPAVNDRVIIEEINGSYVIIGKIVTEIEASGIVRQAASADEATHAATADTATTATTATTAINAENATNATNATTAASCSGNSKTATTSDQTKGFDITFNNAIYGQLVTYVTKEYISSLGKSVVTDISTSSTYNFTYK